MEFSIFNPPPAVEIPEPPEPTLILPSSTSEVGCIAMATYMINEMAVEAGEAPPSVLLRGATVKGAHLREVGIGFQGNINLSPQALSGVWRCLTMRIIEGGARSWGIVQRIQ